MINTFIIRLEENEHSCQIAEECLLQAIKHGLCPKYYKAINGNNFEHHYAMTGLKPQGKFKKGKIWRVAYTADKSSFTDENLREMELRKYLPHIKTPIEFQDIVK